MMFIDMTNKNASCDSDASFGSRQSGHPLMAPSQNAIVDLHSSGF